MPVSALPKIWRETQRSRDYNERWRVGRSAPYGSIREHNAPYMKNQTKRSIFSWIVTVAVAIGIAILVNKFVILNVTIPSSSMEDTIEVGERLIAFRQSYLFSDPERGDIVVFPFPDDPSRNFIKRVIGTPGDTVEGVDGVVYVNGEPLDEPYLKEPMNSDFGPYEVPEGCYFMMGDNRNNSADSRAWENTFVLRHDILGKAVFSYYPEIAWVN